MLLASAAATGFLLFASTGNPKGLAESRVEHCLGDSF
jgi:hypothetical protein